MHVLLRDAYLHGVPSLVKCMYELPTSLKRALLEVCAVIWTQNVKKQCTNGAFGTYLWIADSPNGPRS